MRYKIFNYLFVIFFLVIAINFVSATVILGNISGDIENIYGPGEKLRGWINVSLSSEDLNTTISYYTQTITLIDLIRNNTVSNWNCSPVDCNYYYSAIDATTTKSFGLVKNDSKTIGLFVKGVLGDSVTDIYFNVTSDSLPGCSQQLMIDANDDNDMDWIPIKGTSDYSCSKSMGNYDPNGQTIPGSLDETIQYCEKIRVPPMPSMQIGADITKNTGTGAITMSAYDMDINTIGTCEISSIPSSGEYYCIINDVGFLNYTDIYVCIKGPDGYQIKGENVGNVTGFRDLNNNNRFTFDYSIFVKGGKYDSIGSFSFDSNTFKNYIADSSSRGDLKEYLRNYLSSKYNNNCPEGCVIPIKFIAGENQQVTLSNLVFKYGTDSLNVIDNKFYSLTKKYPKLNSEFLNLDISYANFIVPNITDTYIASLRINGDQSLIREEIVVKSIPVISNITPTSVPALIPTNFIVLMDVTGTNMTYRWNFGDDNSEETTNKTSIMHTFQAVGNYPVNIRAKGNEGETNKTIYVEVVSPKDMINSTILSYETDISNFERQLGTYNGIVKSEIERYVNLTNIKETISAEKNVFNQQVIDDNKAVQIMSELISLKIPSRIYISRTVKPSVFLMSRDQLDLERLSNIGAGNKGESFDEDYKSINNWIKNNLNVTFESKSYSISFRNSPDEQLFSDVIIYIYPKDKIDELYLVINGNTGKTKFKEDYGEKDKQDYYGIILNDLDTPKTFEFMYPTITDFFNIPVVISPKFSELSNEPPTNPDCNLNGICESDLEENTENCSDCKKSAWPIIIVALVILIIVFFIVYIILQEWYKKRYESHLFKDKNQLYNLINFINNSELQRIEKQDYFKKLREMGWSSEQLNYAWNKLHGFRTGMWEIPIFKGSENKKVTQELIKRQNTTNTPPPRGFNSRTGLPPENSGRKY